MMRYLNMRCRPFMEADGVGAGGSGAAEGGNGGSGQAAQPFEFDYEKLASIVTGKQSAAEDTVLKGYFKQQGLSADEMAEAIKQFKEQRRKTRRTQQRCSLSSRMPRRMRSAS